MAEFRELQKEPLRRPKENRDISYDFRNNRTRKSNCLFQTLITFQRMWE